MADCEHHDVVFEPVGKQWECGQCELAFYPQTMFDRLEAETNGALDMATAMFSNIMWNLHQRAGLEATTPLADLLKDVQAKDPQEDCDHEFHAGRCKHCGTSQFLGGK